MVKKKAVKKPQKISLPIKFNIPDSIITRFASNMTVQVLENEFKISFFEQFPPLIIGESSPPLPTEIPANCIASVIVSAKQLPKFINALQKQLDIYNRNKPNK